MSVWDVRAGERNGCVHRAVVDWAGALLLAQAATTGSLDRIVAVGGRDRTVSIFDPRKWAVRSKWTGSLKYDIHALHCSSYDANTCYISGLDYEVVCGRWVETGTSMTNSKGGSGAHRTLFSFRGDSRWLGMGKASSGDTLVGLSESCNLFMLKANQGGAGAAPPESLPAAGTRLAGQKHYCEFCFVRVWSLLDPYCPVHVVTINGIIKPRLQALESAKAAEGQHPPQCVAIPEAQQTNGSGNALGRGYPKPKSPKHVAFKGHDIISEVHPVDEYDDDNVIFDPMVEKGQTEDEPGSDITPPSLGWFAEWTPLWCTCTMTIPNTHAG
eukprot:gene7976-9483_t